MLRLVEVVRMNISRFQKGMLAGVTLAAVCAFFVVPGCVTAKKAPVTPAPPPLSDSRLVPGPDDPRIAYETARLMEVYHYSHHPLDTEMSGKFFDGFLAMLDPRRENFLQSDIDELALGRTNLSVLTLGSRRRADLTPAFDIIKRFLQRYQEHVAYVNQLLKDDRFKFNTDERIQNDRRHAPYPKDLDEARQLWRQEVLAQYLQAKLNNEFSPTNGGAILPLSKSAGAEIIKDLTKRYNWQLHVFTNWDGGNVLQYYLAALTHAYDPHSDYMNTEGAQTYSIQMSLSLFGIGATLTEDYGYCTIGSLVPGGPAAKSKQLNPKDRIVAVAQTNQPPVNAVDLELARVVEMIRGPKGTQVRLTIMPADNPASRREVTLIRDEIKLEDQEAKAKLVEQPDGNGGTHRFGIIDLPSFYATIPGPGNEGHSSPKYVSADVAKLLKKLEDEKVEGIILDLRGNPGGSLQEAIDFTGLFINKGPVVVVKSSDDSIIVKNTGTPAALYSGPLVVLQNRFAASASEIVAAALQDYGRAVIVGATSTHGKGTVQSLIRLPSSVSPSATNDPGELKITISKFYRVSGVSTQLKGVESDIVLPDVSNYSTDIGESALENPLPCDTNSPVNYTKLNLVEPYLAGLHQRSDARVATNQDFTYVRQDIDQFKKFQADKTTTLNEKEAIRLHQDEDARKKARDLERAVRPVPDEKIYDITLKNSVTNGLSAPEALTITNQGALLIATNSNGSVSIVTTNNEPAIGFVLNQYVTNTSAGALHYGTVITKPAPDPMLDEAERILADYVSAMKKNVVMMAEH